MPDSRPSRTICLAGERKTKKPYARHWLACQNSTSTQGSSFYLLSLQEKARHLERENTFCQLGSTSHPFRKPVATCLALQRGDTFEQRRKIGASSFGLLLPPRFFEVSSCSTSAVDGLGFLFVLKMKKRSVAKENKRRNVDIAVAW